MAKSVMNHRSVPQRVASVAIAVALVAACSTSSGVRTTPSPDDGTPPATSSVPTVPDPLHLVPDGLFTAPPNPLTLTLTTADDHAAAATIGPDGDTITTTDAAGTTFTLTVPVGAVPLPVTISMTPIATTGGFPADGTPDHTLGVVFSPDGLSLAQPATLTITPATPIDGALAALDTNGDGSEVGFDNFDRSSAGIQIAIEHFSGYIVEYPISLGQVRNQARFLQTKLERQIMSDIAFLVTVERQRQMLGVGSDAELLDLAREVLKRFKDDLLGRRLALAPRGCRESEEAMTAFGSYERTRQLLGAGDDPQFQLEGVTSLVPPTLLDLTVRLCFRERFQFCVTTGDFPGLAIYMFGVFERNHNMLDIDPTPEQLQLAKGYLERCGRWRLTIAARGVTDDQVTHFTHTVETKSEVDLQWHAGNGTHGILGSSIDGSADIEPVMLQWLDASCGAAEFTNVTTTVQASASIDTLDFNRYDNLVLVETGGPLPPKPVNLTLHVHFGKLSYDIRECYQLESTQSWEVFEWAHVLLGGVIDQATVEQGADAIVSKGWSFSALPFEATQHWAAMVTPLFGAVDASVTLTLEHTPSA